MGQQVQTVDVGGFVLLNYGQGSSFEDLGIDPLYEGAADDAPWRAEALERIEQIRKGDLTVIVEDADGNPVPGAQVRVRMRQHAFSFGTAVAASQLLGDSEDSERYRQFVLDNFNMVVFENDLKWPQWEQDRQRALDGVQWMFDHGLTRIRGHNLVWPGWQWLPADLQNLRDNPEALRERIRAHIEDVVSANAGRLFHWDVLNEPYTNRDLQNVLGDEAMSEWFKEARKHDKVAELYINDYNILSAAGADLAHRNHYFKTIDYLNSLETPVQGIGMQGHFDQPTAPEQMLRILDRFGAFGKPIAITEYDFAIKDEDLQARFFRDLLITAFSHPNMTSFLMWGFWEGRHWKPDGAMIRRDWTAKKSHEVWRDLVYGQWWTNAEAESAEDGSALVRGFLGEYAVEAELGDRKAAEIVMLEASGTTIRLKL
jgi:GH35 family endo-1,4-beta-xylanase